MGRARNIFDLSLAGGAVIGIMAVVSPQLLSLDTDLSSMTSAQAVTTKAPVEIAHFLGIAQLVKEPTAYSFVCGEKVGEITSASLTGDRMTISYQYSAEDEMKTGTLNGTVNSDGVFRGDYTTQSKAGTLEGDVSFTFEADGTAEGSYNDSSAKAGTEVGKMQISL